MKAYTGVYSYAFMSYSHKDEDRIKPLIEKLQCVGCNIWYDEGILPADEWAETIAKKLSEAKLFFLILSNNAVASQNVKREIYYAVSNNIPILTFYLEKVELSQGLALQLGISQAIFTKNNVESDYSAIKSVFPADAVNSNELEIIYSTSRFLYTFKQDQINNEYFIIQIDRETRKHKTLFHHKDSSAFLAWYTCESIHFSPSDEFNKNQKNTLFFSVYSDLDHDGGVQAPDLYIQADFSITNPDTDYAKLTVLGGRKKRKEDLESDTEIICDIESSFWLRNNIDN